MHLGAPRDLMKHFVGLRWVEAHPNDPRRYQGSASGFVMAVQGEWYWVTAGHVLTSMEKRWGKGVRFEDMLLDDTSALRVMAATHGGRLPSEYHSCDLLTTEQRMRVPLPFAPFWETPKLFRHVDSTDYGFVPLRQNYRDLLARNGIVPLDESYWGGLSERHDYYVMVGTPGETVGLPTEGTIERMDVLLELERTFDPPDGLRKSEERFYGILPVYMGDSQSSISSIAGMSGGPVFGFRNDETGQLSCQVVAVQSGIWPGTKYTSAYPIELFTALIGTE